MLTHEEKSRICSENRKRGHERARAISGRPEPTEEARRERKARNKRYQQRLKKRRQQEARATGKKTN